MNTSKLYDKLIEELPSLMEANINDDIDFEPQENLSAYIELVEYEISYEREEGYQVYSKEELDKLEQVCKEIKEHLVS